MLSCFLPVTVLVILVMFEDPLYVFNEEDGEGYVVIVKSGPVDESFTVKVTGGNLFLHSNVSVIEKRYQVIALRTVCLSARKASS